MNRLLLIIFVMAGIRVFSQNDLDAIRYSRIGVGGTSRFVAMGGAFGALGADLSCAAYNPAGLGLFRKGELSFSGALKFNTSETSLYNTNNTVSDAKPVFNNFGLAASWAATNDPESRHVIAFNNNQLQNLSSSTRMSGYTNSSSIAKDMLNLANAGKTSSSITGNLNYSYEGLGFNTFLLDTAENQFFSFVDTKRSVKQTRDIVTSGRVNDLNFSYAYAYKDKYYVGASVGFPQVEYESSMLHTEVDDRDSMRIGMTSPDTYTTTYIDEPPVVYTDKLGFSNLSYEEYFKTSGGGVNLKLGGVARVNDNVRVGMYYHTPTLYTLSDEYYNQMNVAFDYDPGYPYTQREPENGGYFKYKIVTPSRIGANAAFITGKKIAVGLDYEMVNYKKARLSSTDISDFAGVNNTIASKYKAGHNIRAGVEYNLSPLMLRVGYAMQGSPFGQAFTGNGVRNTFSAGAGFRANHFFMDFTIAHTVGKEDYFLFTTLNTKTSVKMSSTLLAVTAGFKF